MQDVSTPEADPDLARLESGIRQLKIQYDMFFAGAIPRQPFELRGELERLIKRYSNAPIRKYATRFHFNALVSRFNSLSELWSKTLRTQEEGDRPAPAVIDRRPAERVVATCRIDGNGEDDKALRALHARYLEARRRAGDENGNVSFATFKKGVASQAGHLRDKAGCERVELRLIVKDRKVRLKARPGR